MSTETHQAELLARWLSQSPDGGVRPEPPGGLDADVVDAISALRPDRAPAPRIGIEDILFEVADGPLAEAVDPAALGALGALLDDGSLDADLDPDVLDAVSVLRPDRAPAPRVSIDDILAEVKTGPFAAGGAATGAPTATLPSSVPSEPAPLAAPANAGPPGRRRLPGWLWPSLGGLAVAATALLFVGPMATTAMDAPSASSAPSRIAGNGDATTTSAPMAAAEAPMEEVEREEREERGGEMKPTAPMGGAPAPQAPALAAGRAAPAKDAAPSDARSQLEALGYLDGGVAAGPQVADGTSRGDAGAHAASGSAGLALEGTSGGDVAGADFAYGTGVTTDKRAGNGGLLGGAELAEVDAVQTPPTDSRYADAASPRKAAVAQAPAAAAPMSEPAPAADPAPSAPGAVRERTSRGALADREAEEEQRFDRDSRDYADDDMSEDLDDEAVATGAVVTETVSRGGGGGFLRKSAPKARKAKRSEAAAAEPPPPPPARNNGDGDLSELRAAAWPLSAPPSTRGRAPDGWAAVDAARASGDPATVEAALDALIRGPDDAVAQEAAWELARHHLQRGRRDLALVSVARGLERPSGHPLARARLLALQGEVLEQRGDPAGAKESYKRAVRAR